MKSEQQSEFVPTINLLQWLICLSTIGLFSDSWFVCRQLVCLQDIKEAFEDEIADLLLQERSQYEQEKVQFDKEKEEFRFEQEVKSS